VAEHPEGELVWVDAPAYGYGAVGTAPGVVTATEVGETIVLENALLRAEIGSDGRVRSLIERTTGREALADPGNLLQLYDDRPTAFDAWDIDPFHLETVSDTPPASSVTIVTQAPLRAEVAIEWRFGRASSMRQVVRLDAGSGRLEFHCEADWHEQHTLLKVLFPVAVRSANATYQMQFGHTERPTHYSTSHDLARYEVPGHRFADLSEYGFGVALLTDCKYGYSTFDNQMRISLLRSPTAPDPDADIGRHQFAYAVLPHAGGWREAGVVAESARFETPLRWVAGTAAPHSWFAVDDPNLVLDTVKRAEDSDALVLRLYEAHGARGVARIRVGLPFSGAEACNLLEDARAALPVQDGAIELDYTPHQIITVLVR
jgi:alpha-mannosidase